MACSNPIYARFIGVDAGGKKHIKIIPKRADLYSKHALEARYGKDRILVLPCGKCLACRLNHAKEWAVRCVLEAKSYNYNYFLTLTYDDAHIGDNKLDKRDLQLFLKRVRHVYPEARYFACGEYGSTTHRKHYHLILFNANIEDLKLIGHAGQGAYLESKTIRDLWSKGNILITEFSYGTASYIARYTTKKIMKDDKDEFITMSLKPGLGYEYFQKNYRDIYDVDKIYGNFGNSTKVRPPRYFDKLLEKIDLDKFNEIKENRINCAQVDALDFLIKHNLKWFEEAYDVQSDLLIGRIRNDLKRGL